MCRRGQSAAHGGAGRRAHRLRGNRANTGRLSQLPKTVHCRGRAGRLSSRRRSAVTPGMARAAQEHGEQAQEQRGNPMPKGRNSRSMAVSACISWAPNVAFTARDCRTGFGRIQRVNGRLCKHLELRPQRGGNGFRPAVRVSHLHAARQHRLSDCDNAHVRIWLTSASAPAFPGPDACESTLPNIGSCRHHRQFCYPIVATQ